MTSEELIRAGFEASRHIDQTDPAAWRALAEQYWTEDILMVEDPRFPEAAEFSGREAVAGRFAEYLETFSDAESEVETIHRNGDRFVAEIRFVVSGMGSGLRVEQRWAWLVETRDEKLSYIRAYLELDEALADLESGG